MRGWVSRSTGLDSSFGGVIFRGFNLGFGGVTAIEVRLSVSTSTSLTEIATGKGVFDGSVHEVNDIRVK
jgi:hypothetical protein